MADNRIDRELEKRERTPRKQAWRRPELLPSPTPQAGYTFHWVRLSTRGQSDAINVSSKLREGWEPVKSEEQPKFQMMVDPNSRFKNNIEVGGLLLCKIPEEFMAQRGEYFAKKNRDQIESVDNNFMRENNPRMPLFSERKSSSSFGKGK